MNTKYIIKSALLAGAVLALSSCQEEKIYGIDPSAVPQASDYDIKVTVDQETNQFSLDIVNKDGTPATGVYPIWKVYTGKNPITSTRLTYTNIVAIAGDYDVEMQVGNHHGVSEGVKTGTIHLENTIFDFTPYIDNLTGGGSKVWHIDGGTQGHLGCGESGTDGLNWWSAAPYDKKDWGVYDNTMTFTDNGGSNTGLYTYDPGASGTIYINKEITDLSPYSEYNPLDDNDYCAPAPLQENVTFTLGAEGADLVLSFPKGTLMGYLPNMDLYNEPKFKVNAITRNTIELTCDNGGIAWHYILAPFEEEVVFNGFKYDYEFNLWKDAEVSLQSTWFADEGWGGIDSPEVTVTNESIKLHTPEGMGSQQWQGQVHIGTNIPVSADKNYDFSCWVNAPQDSKVTVKVQKDGDDGVFFSEAQIQFYAGGSCFYFVNQPGFDGTLKIALDFGGNPDTDFEITNIVFKDHANDDGSVVPDQGGSDDPGLSVTWVDVDSPDNLWNGADASITTWTSGDDWGGNVAEPNIDVDGNYYSLFYTEAPGGSQWMAQFALHTALDFSADKVYDFRVTISPDANINGVTVKPTMETDDNVFWSDARHDVYGLEDNVISLVGMTGKEIDDFKLVFDFAGVPEGTTVVIKDIIIQEHHD